MYNSLMTQISLLRELVHKTQEAYGKNELLKCLSRRWQARPRNFTPSQLTALKSTNTKKLASIVIRNLFKNAQNDDLQASKNAC
jgi:hypothetical protein